MIKVAQHELDTLQAVSQLLCLPDDYLVIDCETTGFKRDGGDFILDLGFVRVENNEIVDHGNAELDWSQHPDVSDGYVQERLAKLAKSYGEAGRPLYYDWERLCRDGQEPCGVLHRFANMMYEHLTNNDTAIIGHGFRSFDRPMIDKHTELYLQGYQLPWAHGRVIDTGLVEKAIQAELAPHPSDDIDTWFNSVNGRRIKGVKWSLQNHCDGKYKISERFGLNPEAGHTAVFDCLLGHHMVQTFKEMLRHVNGEPSDLLQVEAVA